MAAAGGERDAPAARWSPEWVEVDPVGVVRACAWPLSTLAPFHHLDLAAAADTLLDRRARLEDEGRALAEAIAAVVPEASPDARRHLLRIRRAAFRGLAPDLSPADVDVLRAAGLDDRWRAFVAASDEVRSAHEEVAAAHAAAAEADRRALRSISDDAAFGRALLVANRGLAARWRELGDDSTGWRARDHRAATAVFRYLLRATSRPVPQGLWAGVAAVRKDPLDRGAAVRVLPDPAVLRPVVDARARSGQVLDRRLALDASVHHHRDGWRFEHGGKEMAWSTVRSDPLIDAVVEALWIAPSRLREVDHGLSEAEVEAGVLERLATDLLAIGFVVPMWSASEPGDLWEILAGATAVLTVDEADKWTDALAELRTICAELERDLLGVSPAVVAARLEAAADVVAGLWAWAGLAEPAPPDVLVVDLALPSEMGWPDEGFETVARAVREQLAEAYEDGEAERARVAATAGVSAGPLAHVLAEVSAVDVDGAERRPGAGCGPGPEGSVLVSRDGEGLLLALARPQADVFVGRYADLTGVPGLSPHAVNVVLDDAPNPAAARSVPTDTGLVCSRRAFSSFSARGLAWTSDHRPLLLSGGRPLWLRYPASAGPGTARELLLARVALGHGWEEPSRGVPVAAEEVGRLEPTEAVHLPGGARRSRRRWVLGPDELAELTGTAGLDAYLALRRILGRRGLAGARLAWLRFGPEADAQTLALPVTSPLAVAAAVERLDPQVGAVLEEHSSPAWSTGSGDRVLEVAVRWQDPEYWSRLEAAGELRRRRAPRSDFHPIWHQFDLAVDVPDGAAPDLPLAEVGGLLTELRASGLAGQAFFMRKPPGLRLRVTGGTEVLEHVQPWADALVASGRLAAWTPGIYRPERRRFGGAYGMTLAHQRFTADTACALAVERVGPGIEARLAVSHELTKGLVEGTGVAWTEVVEVLDALTPASTVAAEVRARVAGVLADGSLVSGPIADWVAPVRDADAAIAAELLAAADGAWLEVPVAAWVAAVTAFQWNRLGLPLHLEVLGAYLDWLASAARPARP